MQLWVHPSLKFTCCITFKLVESSLRVFIIEYEKKNADIREALK